MVEKIVRRNALKALTGLGNTKINEMIADGTFPQPVPLGVRAVGWLESEIEEWQQQRIERRLAPTEAEIVVRDREIEQRRRARGARA